MRHNKNVSLRLTRPDGSCYTEAEMQDVAFNYFNAILGSEQQVELSFDITGRVGPNFVIQCPYFRAGGALDNMLHAI
jgi:hypothetical protein